MNVSKADKQRYWITFLLDDLVEGSGFEPGLLHVTVVPWFVTDLDNENVIKSFRSFFSEIPGLQIKVGGKVKFGPRNDVSVSLIEENTELSNIHKLALDWLHEVNARWAVKNPYVGDEYSPHIRRRQGTKIKEGDIISPKFLTLVRANRHEDNMRIVAAKVKLHEQD